MNGDNSSDTTTSTTAAGSSRLSGSFSRERVFAVLYVLLTAVATLSLFSGFPTALKTAYIPFVCLGAWSWIRRTPDETKGIARAWLGEYLLYILLMFLMTSLIYALQKSDLALVARGYQKLAYQTLTIAISVFAFYLFGKKAVDYTFYGFVLFYTAAIVIALHRFGLSASLTSIRRFLMHFGDAKDFMKALELHDAVFAFGIFILYYFLDGVKKNPGKLCLAVFFFLVGFKRIGALAILLALPLGAILRKYCRDLKKTGLVLGALIILAGFAYIAWIKEGRFAALTGMLGVNSMGRNELFRFISDYYSVSPAFLGKGFEYVTILLRDARVDYINLAKIGAIHNDYIKIFVEFGFFGYFLWTGYWLLWHQRWTGRFGNMAMLAQLLVSVYLFTTYTTDNTAFYFSTGVVARLVPMAFALQAREAAADRQEEKT